MAHFLACSGGGDRGIVLLGMIKELNKHSILKYNEMAGISAGSLVCALLSMSNNYEDDLDKKINLLLDKNFKVTGLWTTYFNTLDAYLFHQSIYTSKPLKNLIDKNFDKTKIKTPFKVGVYNKTLAAYESAEPTTDTILASASIPIVLPSVKINNYDYEDGGMRHLIPVPEIKDWIKRTAGPKHIDLLMCFPVSNKETFMKMLVPQNSSGIVNIALRSLADITLSTMSSDLNDISDMMNITYEQLIQKPCNTFTYKDVTLRILSPYYGWYSGFEHMTPENSLKLLNSGMDTVRSYLSEVEGKKC